VTVVGHAAAIAAGEWIAAFGEWVNDRTHGQQFKARFLRASAPTSADGIEKYLSSGMIQRVAVQVMTENPIGDRDAEGFSAPDVRYSRV
jgi:hypothetical protein